MVGQMKNKKPQAVAAEEKATQKRKNKRSAATIREAASMINSEDCKLIVNSLVENAKAGEIQSIKLLYNFAHSEEEAGESEDIRHFRSSASELANAPQWKGDWPKEQDSKNDETVTDS